MRARLLFVFWLLSPSARADSSTAAHSEIGLARMAEELGDAVLVARLGGAGTLAERLLAARASLYARAPEALITPLATLACGRHPQLAPEAAFSLLRIAEQLRPSELAARESLTSDLQKARDSLACAQSNPPPRADIVQRLALAAAALRALSL